MKFLFIHRSKKQPEQHEGKTVLFVCVENAGRSQMAEGFIAISAGTKPSAEINPLAIQVMKEVG